MILDESKGAVPAIKIKYMNEEGIKVSARPILVLTCPLNVVTSGEIKTLNHVKS